MMEEFWEAKGEDLKIVSRLSAEKNWELMVENKDYERNANPSLENFSEK